jgi:hypothetical protein
MRRFFYLLCLCVLSVCLAAFCVVASAETIVNVSSVHIGNFGPEVYSGQAIQLYWTQSQEFEDVSISVPLLSPTISLGSLNPSAPLDVNAYLTSTSGPGTLSPPVASASFSAPASVIPVDALLFSDLTLDPGTYYLTLYSSQPSGPLWLPVVPNVGPPPVITTAPGVTISNAFASDGGGLDANYAPASTFFLDGNLINSGYSYLDVTVTGTAVPEPPTWWLMASAVAILIWCRKSWRIRA